MDPWQERWLTGWMAAGAAMHPPATATCIVQRGPRSGQGPKKSSCPNGKLNKLFQITTYGGLRLCEPNGWCFERPPTHSGTVSLEPLAYLRSTKTPEQLRNRRPFSEQLCKEPSAAAGKASAAPEPIALPGVGGGVLAVLAQLARRHFAASREVVDIVLGLLALILCLSVVCPSEDRRAWPTLSRSVEEPLVTQTARAPACPPLRTAVGRRTSGKPKPQSKVFAGVPMCTNWLD